MGESQPARTIGRYALFREIASGGMASVHLGRLLGPVGFSRVVAIKRLHPHLARDPEFVTMFIDEARLAARIAHPNVVPTLDVVALEGEIFIVMEYVEGESLARLVRLARAAETTIPISIATSLISSTLSGLHAAHEARGEGGRPLLLVHRDVSPQNILVGVDGLVRVVDFGIAMAADRKHRTASGVLKGKLRYMAPEQILLEPVDRRTDVYASAVVLWELLAGKRLFTGDSDFAVADQIRKGVTTPPSELNPEVPAKLDEIVLRGLARKPADRFETAAEMADALAELPSAAVGAIGRLVQSLAADAIARRRELVDRAESSEHELPPELADDSTARAERDDEKPTSRREATASFVPALPRAHDDPSSEEVLKTKPGGAFARRALESPEPRLSPVVAEDGASATRATWTVGDLTRRIPTPLWGALVGVVLFAVGMAIYAARSTSAPTNPVVDSIDSSKPPAPAAMQTTAPPSTSAASHPPISSETSTPPSAPSKVVRAKPAVAPPSSAKPTAKSKDPCSPPWYLDKNGDKRFRKECL